MIWRLHIHKVVLCLPDSWSNWNLDMLVFEERGKLEYPEKNLLEQRREPTTNSTLIWRRRRDLCPGHLRWLNTVLTVCEFMSFAKSWKEKGCSSQAETWQVKNILMKDFDWQVKCDVFVVSMATWTIEYNLKILLLLSLHKIRSLDFPIKLHTAYYN